MGNLQKNKAIDKSSYYRGRSGYRGPYQKYERYVLELLNPDKSLLDIGCGREFPMAAKWLSSGAKVYGVDPFLQISSTHPKLFVFKCTAENLPFGNEKFDLIISCAVLEHLKNPQNAFYEIDRILKPNGFLILLTPSKYDYVSIVSRIIPNSFHGNIVTATEGRSKADTFPTHYRANSRKDIIKLSINTNFRISKFEYLDQSPYALKFSPLLYRIGCRYHFIINSINKLNFLKGWVFCVLKK